LIDNNNNNNNNSSKNVLLDEYHNVFVSDFGLSREKSSDMTIAGVCNPRWRPPELTRYGA
jgi:serine/threonine protein kinase